MKKKIVYLSLLIMMFSLTTLYGSEAPEIIELKVEDAIIKAQKRDKRLRVQRTNIDYAELNTQAAREALDAVPDNYFDETYSQYSKATANAEYERKNEDVIAEQVAFDIETQFDDILELEEKYELAYESLVIQRQKVSHAVKKEELGLGSKVATKNEKIKLEAQKKDIEGLNQAIEAGYRKLNDAIGGKEEKYILLKENIYEPLNKESSLQGQISNAINSDIGLWLQEEVAEAGKVAFAAPGPDGYAPTYTLYQQRQLAYQQAKNNVVLSKEGKEKQVKQIYDNIQALEIQHDKIVIDLEEAQRQYGIMKKRYELGMITLMNLEEVNLSVLQNQVQLSSAIRQHNQLKMMFQKTYLGVGQGTQK